MAGSGLKLWIGRLLLVSGSLILTLLVCELVARMLLPPPQLVKVERTRHPDESFGTERETRDTDLSGLVMHGAKGRRLVPNTRAISRSVSRNMEEIVLETNSLGLRYGELGPKESDEYRVLVLGDSVTMGIEVHDHELFTNRAEALLADRPVEIRVINGGVVSADLTPTFYQMLELFEPVDPDVVVLQLYYNDAKLAGMFAVDLVPGGLRSSRFMMWAANQIDRWRQTEWISIEGEDHDWDAWAAEFAEHQRRVYGGDRESFERMDPAGRDLAAGDYGLGWSPVAWAEIEKVIRAARDVCIERGVELVVMLAPVDLQVYGATIDRVPQEFFAAMCGRLELHCLDLLPPLRAHRQSTGDPVLYDQCHFTPIGHRIVAEALVATLEDERLLPR
jgi:lysophospholipase L1-like esterase